jgi:hypothetical protein
MRDPILASSASSIKTAFSSAQGDEEATIQVYIVFPVSVGFNYALYFRAVPAERPVLVGFRQTIDVIDNMSGNVSRPLLVLGFTLVPRIRLCVPHDCDRGRLAISAIRHNSDNAVFYAPWLYNLRTEFFLGTGKT